jgi:hypothetical protein
MNLTKEQEERIVLLAVEEILRRMPTVIENLIVEQAAINSQKDAFYKKYPELSGHKELVAKMISELEGQDLCLDTDKLLDEAAKKASVILADKEINFSIPDALNIDRKFDGNGEI